MNCRFCYGEMVAGNKTYPTLGKAFSEIKEWLCYNCPNAVRQFSNTDSFTIMVRYNESWYEVEQMYTQENSKEPPLLSISKCVFYEEEGKYLVKNEFVLELNVDGKITPQNIQDKIATILTFS